MWFDSHSHVFLMDTNVERQAMIVQRCRDEFEMVGLINVCVDVRNFASVAELGFHFPGFAWVSAGWYPSFAMEFKRNEKLFHDLLKDALRHPSAIAVGECGLDYFRFPETMTEQKELLRMQVCVANEMNLPLILHTRDAYEDMLALLRCEAPEKGGVLHCYSGVPEYVEDFLDLGLYVSFAGNATFKSAENIRKSCLVVPENRLLVETDSPYLTPVPWRGKENRPWNVAKTGELLAKIRGVSLSEIACMTFQNAKVLFGLEKGQDDVQRGTKSV